MRQDAMVNTLLKQKTTCRNRLKYIFSLMTIFCLASCEENTHPLCANSEREEGVCLVSLNTLSENPSLYQGRIIELSGFPDKTFGDKVSYILYSTRDARAMQEPGNKVAVYLSTTDSSEVEDRRHKSMDGFDPIWVIGTFNTSTNKAKLLGTIRNAKLEAIQ